MFRAGPLRPSQNRISSPHNFSDSQATGGTDVAPSSLGAKLRNFHLLEHALS